MASLSPNSILSSLISTGSDATLNLFTVEIPIFDSMEGVFFRIQNFKSPKRNSSVLSYNYRNLQVSQVAPSTDISRTVEFNIRLDSNYELLYLLRDYQCTDNLGNFTTTDKCIQEVTVTTYSSQLNSQGNYTPVYQWKLYNCYIVSISEISYGYDASNTTNVTVTMVFGDFTEGAPVNVEDQQGDNSSYYENQRVAQKRSMDAFIAKKGIYEPYAPNFEEVKKANENKKAMDEFVVNKKFKKNDSNVGKNGPYKAYAPNFEDAKKDKSYEVKALARKGLIAENFDPNATKLGISKTKDLTSVNDLLESGKGFSNMKSKSSYSPSLTPKVDVTAKSANAIKEGKFGKMNTDLNGPVSNINDLVPEKKTVTPIKTDSLDKLYQSGRTIREELSIWTTRKKNELDAALAVSKKSEKSTAENPLNTWIEEHTKKKTTFFVPNTTKYSIESNIPEGLSVPSTTTPLIQTKSDKKN